MHGNLNPVILQHIQTISGVYNVQDELAERSSPAAEQPDTARQPNALQEEAAVAVRPDPEQDIADSKLSLALPKVALLCCKFCSQG